VAHSLYSLVESVSRLMATNKHEMGNVLETMQDQYIRDRQPPDEIKELGWAHQLLQESQDLPDFLSKYRQTVGAGVNPQADAGRSRNRAALRSEGDAGVTVYEQQEDLFPARQAVRRVFGGAPGGTPTNLLAAAAHADKMNRVYQWMAGLDQLIKANPNFPPMLAVRRDDRVVTSGVERNS
jgi:hypothetical protein